MSRLLFSRVGCRVPAPAAVGAGPVPGGAGAGSGPGAGPGAGPGELRLVADPQYRRLRATVDMDRALQLYNVYR